MWHWSVCLNCVLILKLVVNFTACYHKVPNERMSEEVFSADFENFLKGLGSKVYKFKTAQVQGAHSRRNEYSYTRPATKKPMSRHEANPQKDVFEDMLMLKLVSYYENKYKVDGGHTPNEMTSGIPTFPAFFEKPKKVQIYNVISAQPTKKKYEPHSKQRVAKHQSIEEVIVL